MAKNETDRSSLGFVMQINNDDQELVVKQCKTVSIPIKLMPDTEDPLDIKLSVTEFPEYPEGRAPLYEEKFTREITSSVNDNTIQKSVGSLDDVDSNITFTASKDVELGQRVLAITAVEGSAPYRSFVQSFLKVTIVE
jgi:uncharacterized membrane protein